MSPQAAPGALALSRRVLKILIAINIIMGVLISILLIASLIAKDWVIQALGGANDPAFAARYPGMRVIMIFGIIGAPIAHAALSRLLAIVETVRNGDPFVVENAERLKKIAWAVLSLEILRVVIAIVAKLVSTTQTSVNIKWDFSVPSWLAIILLFVLARVFETGARMRADLEGTV